MRAASQTIKESLYSGAILGITPWVIYAIVECWFSSILPWIIQPSYTYKPLHWGFTALLFLLYPAIGLVLGGLSGLGLRVAAGRISSLQKLQPATLFPAVATFTVVLTFAVNLIVQLPFNLFVAPPLFISLLLTFALVLSASSSAWAGRLCFLTSPWAVSIVLLGLPWVTGNLFWNYSISVKTLVALAYPALVFLISFFIQKVAVTPRSSETKSPISSPLKSLAFLTPVAFVVLGISFFLDQTPYMTAANLKPPPPVAEHPNVLLITMDTVRADHLSLYGYERDTTPNLKKFSEGATLYSHAVASSDMTLSTHASIFTGMYARQHGAHYNPPDYPGGRPLDEKFYTLTEILSEKGYSTLGVVSNYAYLRHAFRLDQGFQYYDQRELILFLGETEPYYLREGVRDILTRFASSSQFDMTYRRAGEINEEVFTLLGRVRKEGAPFFLFVNYMDAHWPYIPPPPFDALYPGKDETFTTARYSTLEKQVLKLKRKVTEREQDHLVSQYDGGIAYLDFHMGKLFERLKEMGLYENTLIIITSDHGEVFGERGLIGHGVSVYQDQVYVPLVIKYPNVSEGQVWDEVVSVVDIMPTVLDVLGYKMPEEVRGQSLLKLEPQNPRVVISESFPNGGLLDWHQRFHRVERAVFSGTLKFISSTAGKRELYDLSKDPDERENLYKTDGVASMKLEVSLSRWIETVSAETGSSVRLDKADRDRLRSLGYME